MRRDDPESFETELQRLKPAKPPEEFVLRLACWPLPRVAKPLPPPWARASISTWWQVLRWLTPGAVAAAVALALWLRQVIGPGNNSAHQALARPAKAAVKADNVEIDRQLLAAFDAVARLPGGEPVRFRCREWVDRVVLRDSAQGVVIEQRTPRLEIVPVRFETY